MRNLVLAASLALALVGCASTPVLNYSPKEIEGSELEQYWVLKQSQFSTGSRYKRLPKQGAVVEVRYLIDSTGKTHEAQVVKAEPDDDWNRTALKVVDIMEYDNAPGNESLTPVYVITTFTFKI